MAEAEKKYDASRDLIPGDRLMLFFEEGGKMLPVAFGTSCGISLTTDTLDTSNKMSGNWKEFLVGQLGYTVSSESMLSFKEGHLSFKSLKNMMVKRVPIPFVMARTVETNGDFPKGDEYVRGHAIITSLDGKFDNGAICTSSVSLQGTGPLEDGNVTTEPAR